MAMYPIIKVCPWRRVLYELHLNKLEYSCPNSATFFFTNG